MGHDDDDGEDDDNDDDGRQTIMSWRNDQR